MIVVRSVAELRAQVKLWRSAGDSVAFAPTMGALHTGHLSLITLGKQNATRVVASVFVNPTQFAPHEDFDAYPRDLERDAALLAGAGCDLLYAPDQKTMYGEDFATSITVSGVSAPMEGVIRPTHFAGVALIVCKLLNQVAPDIAIFGEKDYQQLQVIKRMVCDLDMNVRVIGAPIIRDHDGLALSSRNAYLNETQYAMARQLNIVMQDGVKALHEGASWTTVAANMRECLEKIGYTHIDYIDLVDPDLLTPISSHMPISPARLLVAAHLGKIRLIDNMAV